MLDFYGKRKIFFTMSLLLILTGLIFFFVNGGFALDIQFQGGTEIQLEVNDSDFNVEDPNDDIIRAEEVALNTVDRRIMVRHTHSLGSAEGDGRMDFLVIGVATGEEMLSDSEQRDLVSELRDEFNIKEDAQMDVNSVSTSISRELRSKGILAVILASILMLLYIWIRFNIMSGLFAGLTAVVALIHDAAIMLSVYVVFGIPLNETFIAAVLTILGYSMNDTIVIYDRIRENSKASRKDTVEGLVNKSINQSLRRSINTSITTLACVTTVFIFASINGISSLQEFSFPLIIGLASGTYSSIFIASPLWVNWNKAHQRKKASQKPSNA
ncbi:protein translocase subunit SecF [Herbivorax sp. ANBcel31]|uniref:protein translocase subunit SecF n=1 Tax=Herbivorax sp. ANBcel31 TaxID=3069754 RepID=UPI0027B30FD7|nr:protein translocase subunit SecF [Herbivorax sp. ANBcel31]MDQ2087229.1 protein translocase subunit SecF [Herbivorax sp. ANBcel31]